MAVYKVKVEARIEEVFELDCCVEADNDAHAAEQVAEYEELTFDELFRQLTPEQRDVGLKYRIVDVKRAHE